MIGKQLQILVFKISDDGTFDNIGEVNRFSSLIWPDKYNGYASFELWAPINDENREFFKKGNIIWCGGNNAAFIEIVKSKVDDDGVETFNVKGRTLEMLLTTRIIWGTYNASNKNSSTVMYDLVYQNFVRPSDYRRRIPFLELGTDNHIGKRITFQKTGGDVYTTLQEIASEADLGFNVLFKPKEKKLIFEVVEGVDRTVNQDTNDPVEFSSDLEDILTSEYYTNDQDYKNVALVMGEGEGSNRKKEISGNGYSSGLLRREMFVDARDLQSSSTSEGGQQVTLSPEEYKQALINRGNSKLAECRVVETFESRIRVLGDVQYKYGVDFFKGDKVTVIDKRLGVEISARITEVEEDFDKEYKMYITFGYSYPTIMQKIKQQIT